MVIIYIKGVIYIDDILDVKYEDAKYEAVHVCDMLTWWEWCMVIYYIMHRVYIIFN
jgi:hypothetical protein